jgi:hypothetical protein
VRYRSSSVFSLGGWTPHLPPGLACPGVLGSLELAFVYGAFTLSRGPFQNLRLAHSGFWAAPLSLATTRGIVSVPRVTEMFQFTRFPRAKLCIHLAVRRHAPARVSPFGHRWLVTGAHPSPALFAVYRVLRRRLTPQAFTVRPCSLAMCCGEIVSLALLHSLLRRFTLSFQYALGNEPQGLLPDVSRHLPVHSHQPASSPVNSPLNKTARHLAGPRTSRASPLRCLPLGSRPQCRLQPRSCPSPVASSPTSPTKVLVILCFLPCTVKSYSIFGLSPDYGSDGTRTCDLSVISRVL